MKEMFTIHVQFIGNKFDGVDKRGRMTETHDEASLMDAVQRLTQGPAAQLGLIEEVKVEGKVNLGIFWPCWLFKQETGDVVPTEKLATYRGQKGIFPAYLMMYCKSSRWKGISK